MANVPTNVTVSRQLAVAGLCMGMPGGSALAFALIGVNAGDLSAGSRDSGGGNSA